MDHFCKISASLYVDSFLEMPAKDYPHKRARTEVSSKSKKIANAAEIRFALRADNQDTLTEGLSNHYTLKPPFQW